MTEQNPLFGEICELENEIMALESGIRAFDPLMDCADNCNAALLLFVKDGFQAIHERLRAKWDALHTAACGNGGES